MNPSLAIELEHVSFTYTGIAKTSDSHTSAVHNDSYNALHDINLSIPQGQWVTIIGTNGSGKTTLSRLLAGISAPSSGRLTLYGETVYDNSVSINREAYIQARRHISYVTQNPEDQIVGATVKDDVAFEPENLGWQPQDTAHAVYSSLDDTRMTNFANHDPHNLSGGQQQRVAFSSALAPQTELLILDEPFAFVDESARECLLETLKNIHKSGKTIILITHHTQLARYSDRVVELHNGEVKRDMSSTDYISHVHTHGSLLPPTQNNIENLGILVSSHASAQTAHNTLNSHPELLVDARDISYSYTDSESGIHNFNMSIARGEFVTISGPNGSGKSTLAGMLSGALRPSLGDMNIYAKRIGFVMQRPEQQLFASTVYDDIAFGPRNFGVDPQEVDERITQITHFLGLESIIRRPVWNLSGGQQRLVALAGILVMKPDFLILDEPTAGVDTATAEKILTLLKSLHRSGTTIVMITHSLNHIQQLATRAIVLNDTGFDITSQKHEKCNTPQSENTHEVRDNTQISASTPLPSQQAVPMSRFDPRVLTIVTLCVLFTSFALETPWQLFLGVVVAGAYVAMSHIQLSKLVKELHGFWLFIAFMGLFNLFFVQTGNEIIHTGMLRITDAGVWSCILYAGRFALLAVIAVSTMHILPANRITDAVESMCKPLKKIGFPVHELALTTSLSLRFLPIITHDFRNVMTAQSLRGATITHGPFSSRIKAIQALIIPSFSSALRHADKLSIALDVRGFDNLSHRVPWRIMRVTWRDYALIATYIAYLIALLTVGTML
ncbi:ATP-binding cassette domain-containing protein [Alloscardovia theropitheci]|uniref:ATP-binding cassette domain-containing protein n=1 Tax=Alloscardovia theropitheci TaxID=2496842 RepID=A0A4V2MTS1_9BIFI|nr:energy-coupling factor transporter ATPase [Alloscardovia theropitheci]TCD53609.1 ATP-binding cassette domain-containing protein [Alloscardovia theropitheci]